MQQALAPPTPSTFEAWSSAIVALAYLVAAITVIVRGRRDPPARIFLAVALLNVGPALGTLLLWREGPAAAFSRSLILLLTVTTLTGAVALFHFTQVFPWRRPWVVRHGQWLVPAYLATPILSAALILGSPDSVDRTTVVFVLAALVVGVPIVGFAAVFLPLAGLMSLYKSYLEARRGGLEIARQVLLWMLVSQAAGGVLAAIVLPLLHMLAVPSAWTTTASGLLSASGLLMPLAYALGAVRLQLAPRR